MEKPTVWTTALALGPFLTLLVRVATRSLDRSGRPAAYGVTTASATLPGDRMLGPQRPAPPGPMALGPFVTLILTLHRRRQGSDSSCRQRTSLQRAPLGVLHSVLR